MLQLQCKEKQDVINHLIFFSFFDCVPFDRKIVALNASLFWPIKHNLNRNYVA